jgi:hypothetical protein
MDKDCFPFFSMLFWCFTKILGLVALIYGLTFIGPLLSFGAGWFQTLCMFGVPAAAGLFLLTTDTVYDIATASMRGKRQGG